jgi:predicted regulator of Ras-like GTPase activity (Roadblock/LC7/MglB family)
VLRVPLAPLIQDWPAALRQEIAGLSVAKAQVALPLDLVEQALKGGQIQFPLKRLCGWIEPAVSRPPGPGTADKVVDLPLKVVAPLFMARYRPASPQRMTEVSDDIPDVFGKTGGKGWGVLPGSDSAPRPEPASADAFAPPVPARAVTPASPAASPVPGPSAPAKAAEPTIDLNAILGPSTQRLAARDIVTNTSKLPGAMGALLALNDGLLVTSAVPPQVKSEVVAAFLPQIFGRMGQYTRELNMGGLRGISFAVEGGSWQLVKEPNIYLAVLCRPDKALPLSELAAIAAELNKQQQ